MYGDANMNTSTAAQSDLRQRILEDPDLVLQDPDVIRALVAQSAAAGRNIVDLRGVLLHRLEDRLERLADTHRDVVAAAYENLAGTQQVHRAVLAIIQPLSFEGFLQAMASEVPEILSLDAIRICLEGDTMVAGQAIGPDGDLSHAMVGLPIGGCRAYCGETDDRAFGPVILRKATRAAPLVFGNEAGSVGSEAVLKLDLGEGRTSAMVVMGGRDPGRFHAQQGTDLLGFFGQAAAATLRRWLA